MERIALRKFYAFLLACLLVFLLIPQAAFASGERSAKIFSTNGSVSVKRGGDKLLPAFEGMRLEQGDVIIAMTSSEAVIEIDGDKTISVDENTEIALSVLQGKIEESQTGISVFLGNIVNSIQNKLTKGSVYTVDTPTAIMGVRGTIFLVGQPMHTAPEVAVSSGLVETDVRGEKTAMVEPGFAFDTDTDRPEPITKEKLISFGPAVVNALTNDALLETLKDASGTQPSLTDLTAQATQYRQQQNEAAAQGLAQIPAAQSAVASDYFFAQPDAKIAPATDVQQKVEAAVAPAAAEPTPVSDAAKDIPAAAPPSVKDTAPQTPAATTPPSNSNTSPIRPDIGDSKDDTSGSSGSGGGGGGGGGSGTVTPPTPVLQKLATPCLTYTLDSMANPINVILQWRNVPNAVRYEAVTVNSGGVTHPLEVHSSPSTEPNSSYVSISQASLSAYQYVYVTAVGDNVSYVNSDKASFAVFDIPQQGQGSFKALPGATVVEDNLVISWATDRNITCTALMRETGSTGREVYVTEYISSATADDTTTFTLTLPIVEARKYNKYISIMARKNGSGATQLAGLSWTNEYPPQANDSIAGDDGDDDIDNPTPVPPATPDDSNNEPDIGDDNGDDDEDDHGNHNGNSNGNTDNGNANNDNDNGNVGTTDNDNRTDGGDDDNRNTVSIAEDDSDTGNEDVSGATEQSTQESL